MSKSLRKSAKTALVGVVVVMMSFDTALACRWLRASLCIGVRTSMCSRPLLRSSCRL